MTARWQSDNARNTLQPDWVSIKSFYVDGLFKAPQNVIDAWHGPKVLINVTGNPFAGGDMLDVENGDATPDHIAAWFDHQHAIGTRYLGVYSSRNQFAACTAALGPRKAHRWIATLDGTLIHSYEGVEVDACQAFGAPVTGLPFDLSAVWNEAFHPDLDVDLTTAQVAQLIHLATVAQIDIATLSAYIKTL